MNRTQLIEALAAVTQAAPADVRAWLAALLGTRESVGVLTTALADFGKVQLAGFGTFEVRERPARCGRHPRTGEPITIGARSTVFFRPAPTLRQHLQASPCSRQPDDPQIA